MTNPLNQYTAITQAAIYQATTSQAAFTLNPTVDLNGSTLNDGRTVSTWDERNQRRSVTQTATGEQLFCKFDAIGRRIKEQELSASNSELRKTRYLFDGWNCVAEFAVTPVTAALVRKKTHTWGLDLSQTPQGAGGVGGLLATVDKTATKAVYTFAYDGNGNVTALYSNGFGLAANYEYDPFGKTISASGPYAAENKYRFSTKPQDRIGGLYYYGYRYYDPVTGRWPSRDPVEEKGEINLYGFVKNNSVDNIDADGRWIWSLGVGLVIEEAYRNLNNCPQQNTCKDPCSSCCSMWGAAGAAGIKAAYTSALATYCVPAALTGPWSGVACVFGFTVLDAIATNNLGNSITTCQSACNKKPSSN